LCAQVICSVCCRRKGKPGIHARPIIIEGQLLASCTNVKTVRLFLTWARESGLLDVDDLRARYPLRTGSDKRWMSRMPDGTLLTLKPHG
jgi:hypothetical protein